MSDNIKSRIKPNGPPLKWAGGKRWLLPHLKPLWALQSGRRLVEPFCGGLSVTLGLMPARAVLNDINSHLINFYRCLQEGLVVEEQLYNEEVFYYESRKRFNSLVRKGLADSKEAAVLFYYLNRTGYNGLCRFNRKGEFNVPFGRYKKIKYCYDFLPYRDLLKNWSFLTEDFTRIDTDNSDFIYADPPYDVEFTAYSREGFAWEDQVRLVEWLDRHSGPVALSNQATGRILDLYTEFGYSIQFLEAPRKISCTGDRTPAREVLAAKGFLVQA